MGILIAEREDGRRCLIDSTEYLGDGSDYRSWEDWDGTQPYDEDYSSETATIRLVELTLLRRDAEAWNRHLERASLGAKKTNDLTPQQLSERGRKAATARWAKRAKKTPN